MTHLYALPVEGAGTAEVEALSSYLYRLSELHSTTAGGLVTALAERWGGFSAPVILAAPAATLVRPNSTTANFASALAIALRRSPGDLEPMTFLALLDALDRSMGTFATKSRWCPACLAEQQNDGRPPHYLLLWQLTAVRTCHRHAVRLRDRCPACHRTQDSYRHRDSLAKCVFCDAALDGVDRTDLETRGEDCDLRGLIRECAQRPGVRFPAGGVARLVSIVFDEAWATGFGNKLHQRAKLNDCIRFCDPSEPVTLSSARRVARLLQVPLADLLAGNLTGTTRPLFGPDYDSSSPKGPGNSRKKVGASLQGRLMRLLEDGTVVHSSLQAVADVLGVSTGALRYWCPEQAKQIVARHTRAVANGMRRKKQACEREVGRLLKSWPKSGDGLPARKRVLASLRAQTGLPKNLLRREIAKHIPWDGYEEARP